MSGVDPRSFSEQWIYGSGCPASGFSASFNRKKMAVEITMRQEAPAFKALENNEVSMSLLKPVPFFEVSGLFVSGWCDHNGNNVANRRVK